MYGTISLDLKSRDMEPYINSVKNKHHLLCSYFQSTVMQYNETLQNKDMFIIKG